jgi:hypothetical protein
MIAVRASARASFLRVLLCFFAMLVSVSVYATARLPVPIINHVDVPVLTGSGKAVTSEQVRDALRAAALAQKWELEGARPGAISARLFVRGKHTVVVEMPYTADKFSILYLDSINMNYVVGQPNTDARNPPVTLPEGVRGIHPYYNKWVQNLRQEIMRELRKL